MTIQAHESEVSFFTPRNQVEAFVKAAAESHGPYDSEHDQSLRLAAAERLAKTMVPGAPVILRRGMVVRGGILLEPPNVVADRDSPALLFTVSRFGQEHDEAVSLRRLIEGRVYGAANPPQEIVAGTADIKSYLSRRVLPGYESKTLLQDGPEFITTLRSYQALRQAGIYASELYSPETVTGLQGDLLTELRQPVNTPLAAEIVAALRSTEPIAQDDLYALIEYHVADLDPVHARHIMNAWANTAEMV